MTEADAALGRHLGERDLLALLAGDPPPGDDLADHSVHVATCGRCASAVLRLAALEPLLLGTLAEVAAEVAETVLPTPLGPLTIAASARGICRIDFGAAAAPAAPDPPSAAAAALLRRARAQLLEYFAGRRRAFELPVDLSAVGPFQRQVLEHTAAVPAGQVLTYGQVARALGRPGAARAVGGALNRNPVPIVVPCHRIVGASGRLVGYAGGLERKRALLELEGALVA